MFTEILSSFMNKVQWNTFPFVEVIVFVIFAWFAIYRRSLSSNDEYRSTKRKSYPQMMTHPQALILESIDYMTKEFVLPSYSLRRKIMKHTRLRFNNFISSSRVSSSDLLTSDVGSTSLIRNVEKSTQQHMFTKLSDDIIFKIIDFLSMKELIALSASCYDLNIYLHSDLVWKHMWMIRFGKLWKSPQIVELRKLRGITWDIGNEILSTYKNLDDNSIKQNIHSNDTTNNLIDPKLSWMHFYINFEYCWIDWLLAGFNTEERCLVGLHGCVLDLTSFLNEHPGSPETLTVSIKCSS